MFLSVNIFLTNKGSHVLPLNSFISYLHTKPMTIRRCRTGLATDSLCGVLWHGWSTCLLYERPYLAWWCHQMETFSPLLEIGAGNSPVTAEFSAQSQGRGALMFSLICAWTNGWQNNRKAGDRRRHRAHYDVTVMGLWFWLTVGKLAKHCLLDLVLRSFMFCIGVDCWRSFMIYV